MKLLKEELTIESDLLSRISAVDHQLAAGNEFGFIRGQIEDSVGDILRFTYTSYRMVGSLVPEIPALFTRTSMEPNLSLI